MEKTLDAKLEALRWDPHGCRRFILADAKDPDMARGISSPGTPHPPEDGREFVSMEDFRKQIRKLVQQEKIDIMLTSVSTMHQLAHRESLFENSPVTPAIRANDTTDIWRGRGMCYPEQPSRPFSTCNLAEARYGRVAGERSGQPKVNLGLYSVTFNNRLESDFATMRAFDEFRIDAAKRGFRYFLEVFAPNVDCGLGGEEIPPFVNDHICRMLAGVALSSRPEFLKIPFFGPRWMEELVAYEPGLIVGILGGGSGTTADAFTLLEEGKKYGARVALFGRKIKNSEDPLTFVAHLRMIADEEITAMEAVKAYHGELEKLSIPPIRELSRDLELTAPELRYLM